jgi:hypothetical protein
MNPFQLEHFQGQTGGDRHGARKTIQKWLNEKYQSVIILLIGTIGDGDKRVHRSQRSC